jgi:Oxidoreductase molybdopterin binding domain
MALFGEFGERRELEKRAKAEGRLPPGQSLTLKWPVLHNGSIPLFDAAKWDFKISGEVEEPKRLTWNEFRALPQTETTSDFHCVTRWSRLDNHWVRVGAGRRGIHGKYSTSGPTSANRVVCVRTRWRTVDCGAWRPDAADRAASLRLEEREVGARVRVVRPRSPRFLGTQRLPRLWRSVERATVFRKLEIPSYKRNTRPKVALEPLLSANPRRLGTWLGRFRCGP